MNETINNHVTMVRELKKPGYQILNKLDDEDVDAIHMALGLSGEVGEVVDLIKKCTMNGKIIDMEVRSKLLEELGDVMFYMVGLIDILGYDIEHVLQKNIEKLRARYPEGYSDKAAQEKADQNGRS